MINALLLREWRIGCRSLSDSAASVVFALLVVCLFPFALSPAPDILQRFAPGLLLVAVLLAQFLAMEKTFRPDLENGTLDLIAGSTLPLPLYVLIKAFALWLATGLPLLGMSPLLLLLLHTDPAAMPAILAALLLATGGITLLGVMGAAITLGSRQPGLLLPLLLIPFTLPVVIFAVALAAEGLSIPAGRQSALFLSALFFLYLSTAPFIAGAALKGAIEDS